MVEASVVDLDVNLGHDSADSMAGYSVYGSVNLTDDSMAATTVYRKADV